MRVDVSESVQYCIMMMMMNGWNTVAVPLSLAFDWIESLELNGLRTTYAKLIPQFWHATRASTRLSLDPLPSFLPSPRVDFHDWYWHQVMSSRYDNRRRDRSRDRGGDWDRERDRERGRYNDPPPRRRGSRSRSPRRGDRDRRPTDRRDYGRDDDRRDRDGRDRRDGGRKDDRDRDRDRDGRGDGRRGDREREPHRGGERERETERKQPEEQRHPSQAPSAAESSSSHPAAAEKQRIDSEGPVEDGEEGEAMDDTNDDDAAMMAMMGMSGFGTTKGKQVTGNQEGGADVKKIRTWRQYMNRRGGFNRPLDKIK